MLTPSFLRFPSVLLPFCYQNSVFRVLPPLLAYIFPSSGRRCQGSRWACYGPAASGYKPRSRPGLLKGLHSNGYRTRLWKHQLQVAFCNRFGVQVKVCHYPPGSSKWNPIEHRMFAFICRNWAAEPLRDYETVLKFIRTTKTSTGLRVRAMLNTKHYSKGIRITDHQMLYVSLKTHTQRPNWNYSITQSIM